MFIRGQFKSLARWRQSAPQALKAVGYLPLLISLSVIGLLFAVAPHVANAQEVQFDIQFLKWLQDVMPADSRYVWKIIYKGTGSEVTAVMVLIALITLVKQHWWSAAKGLAFATLGILIAVDQGLKPIYYRRRPLESLVEVDGRSFPSGHAAGAVVFYYYLAYLLVLRYPQYRWQIYSIATAWVLLIGIASMFCRVHWPSDIVAGYGFGFVWLTLTLFILHLTDPKWQQGASQLFAKGDMSR